MTSESLYGYSDSLYNFTSWWAKKTKVDAIKNKRLIPNYLQTCLIVKYKKIAGLCEWQQVNSYSAYQNL
jgi:hypothetical protein